MIDEINFLQMVVLICCWVFKAVLLWKNIDTEYWYFSIFQILILIEYFIDWILIRVNLFQKPLFLHQLTHDMTRDCLLNSLKNTSLQHVVYKNFVFVLTFKTIFVNMYFSGNSMNNLSSYCGLTDSRMRVSEKIVTCISCSTDPRTTNSESTNSVFFNEICF